MSINCQRQRIKHWLLRLRFQAIRVFCIHEVSETDENSPDWIPIVFFKEQILQLLKDGYRFISLKEALGHITTDVFRYRKYAVLTADDGLRCHLELLPWLEEHKIPITLSLNVRSLSQNVCGLPYKQWYGIEDAETEKQYAERLYISDSELKELDYKGVSIALHGVNHDEAATDIPIEAFEKDVIECLEKFDSDMRYVPFFVYKYGKFNGKTDLVLKKYGLTPVLADGEKNYNDRGVIHREIFEVIYRKCQQK